jgi:asparagine synthase (glutamine-hydrolysing)
MISPLIAANLPQQEGTAITRKATSAAQLLSRHRRDMCFLSAPSGSVCAEKSCLFHLEEHGILVMCSGAITNFDEVNAQLRNKSKAPPCSSSAMLAAYGYLTWGEDVATHISGAVCLGIWDGRTRSLVMITDRYGERTLFSAQTPEGVIFSTDVKGLLAWPGFQVKANLLGIHDFIQIRHAVPPMTCFEGISRVTPGQVVRVHDGEIAARYDYWRRAEQNPTLQYDSIEAAAEAVLPLFDDAVNSYANSDRPVGALLSGGVDSGAIVARLSQMQAEPVKTFCAAFPQEGFNEVELAQLAADRYKTDHHVFMMGPEVLDRMGELVWHYGSPFTDSSSLVTTGVMLAAKDHVDVLLGGDGAEQVFLGAGRYRDAAEARRVQENGGVLPDSFQPMLAAQGDTTMRDVLLRNTGVFRPAQKQAGYGEALVPYLLSPTSDRLGLALENAPSWKVADLAAEIESRGLLAATFLIKNNVAADFADVEIRMPFLDHKLSDAVTSLPYDMRVLERHGETRLKGLLRVAMEPYLDHQVLYGQNLGFGVPIREWFRNEARGFLTDVLLSRQFLERDLFTRPFIELMLDQHMAEKIDHSPRLWCLLNLELWFRTFIDRSAVEGPLVVAPRG